MFLVLRIVLCPLFFVSNDFIGSPTGASADRALGLPRGDVETLPHHHLVGLLDGSELIVILFHFRTLKSLMNQVTSAIMYSESPVHFYEINLTSCYDE